MSKRLITSLLLFVSLAALTLLSSACDRSGPPQNALLRLAYPHKIQYLPLILLNHKVPGKKIPYRPVIGTGGIDAAEALLAGEADIGAMGDVPALILLSRDKRFQVICAFMQSPTMHRLVGSCQSGVTTLTRLAGKRLAVQFGSSTHGALLGFLKEHKISSANLKLVPLSPVNFPEAMLNGAVDAIAGSEPWPQNVLDRVPKSTLIATLRVSGHTFPHLLIAKRRLLTERRQELDDLLRKLAENMQIINRKPVTAANIAAQNSGRTPDSEARSLKELCFALDFSGEITLQLEQTAAFLRQQGKIKSLPSVIQLRPVQKLQP